MIRYRIDVIDYLKHCGYSQSKLCSENFISGPTLTKIRHGQTVVNLHLLDTLCKLTGLQISDIIEYIPDSVQ